MHFIKLKKLKISNIYYLKKFKNIGTMTRDGK